MQRRHPSVRFVMLGLVSLAIQATRRPTTSQIGTRTRSIFFPFDTILTLLDGKTRDGASAGNNNMETLQSSIPILLLLAHLRNISGPCSYLCIVCITYIQLLRHVRALPLGSISLNACITIFLPARLSPAKRMPSTCITTAPESTCDQS